MSRLRSAITRAISSLGNVPLSDALSDLATAVDGQGVGLRQSLYLSVQATSHTGDVVQTAIPGSTISITTSAGGRLRVSLQHSMGLVAGAGLAGDSAYVYVAVDGTDVAVAGGGTVPTTANERIPAGALYQGGVLAAGVHTVSLSWILSAADATVSINPTGRSCYLLVEEIGS